MNVRCSTPASPSCATTNSVTRVRASFLMALSSSGVSTAEVSAFSLRAAWAVA
jgi:hypothetical protein